MAIARLFLRLLYLRKYCRAATVRINTNRQEQFVNFYLTSGHEKCRSPSKTKITRKFLLTSGYEKCRSPSKTKIACSLRKTAQSAYAVSGTKVQFNTISFDRGGVIARPRVIFYQSVLGFKNVFDFRSSGA